jgi:hypothetical protein
MTARQPGELYWPLVEPVWRSLSIYAPPTEFVEQFSALPTKVRHLFAAHWCQSEVRNGGFHQFFSNSTGVLAPEALAAFRAMGLTEWAAILEEAMRFFGEPYPRERGARLELLSRGRGPREEQDPFSRLDEQFYAWLVAEDTDRWCRAADAYAEAG